VPQIIPRPLFDNAIGQWHTHLMKTVELRSMGGSGKTALQRVADALETATHDGAVLRPEFALKIARAIRARAFLYKARDRFAKFAAHDECLAAFPLDRATAEDSAAWEELLAAVADLPSDQLPHILAMLRDPK
jgi:hypothetical protein